MSDVSKTCADITAVFVVVVVLVVLVVIFVVVCVFIYLFFFPKLISPGVSWFVKCIFFNHVRFSNTRVTDFEIGNFIGGQPKQMIGHIYT